ncbi:Chorismate synthase AroC [Helicobacter ailurogastricus]|uniref:chorismate synthase n=1 Tax=Helicobacter ailurogastricus TaxID=1578720 RepID=UPI00244D7EF2|nr:chorismate synthase [Helicobacter ailurogastricus]GMB90215.1 Chorismate synthase AroC [Helicobacter ailurogastricus]
MNTLGRCLRLSTFGESHGVLIGGVLEGVPAGLKIDLDYLQTETNRRKSVNAFTTPRHEEDIVEVVSGVFEGVSTGAPIGLLVYNRNIRSKDYGNIKEAFRPGHADFTTLAKYGVRDYRGGGRTSARESVARVAAGAIAKMLLKELGIEVFSGVFSVGGIEAQNIDFNFAKTSPIFSLDQDIEAKQQQAILKAKAQGNSVGGVVLVQASGAHLLGLGEPLYDKLDARLASVFMGLNGVKGVFIGEPRASNMQGGSYNDALSPKGFKSNHSGGVLGGIGNGEDLVVWVHFKPTASIAKAQDTITTAKEPIALELKGRHDPCIAIRGSVVCESLLALIVADFALLNMPTKLSSVRAFYRQV